MPKCNYREVANNFIETALWHGCSPVNLLHNFRTPFPKNTSAGLLLYTSIYVAKNIYSANRKPSQSKATITSK